MNQQKPPTNKCFDQSGTVHDIKSISSLRTKTERDDLKCIFFGLGSIGNRLSRIVKDQFGYRVYAFRTKSKLAPELDIKVIHSIEEMADLAPDVAFITNPTALHLETAVKAATMGAHLFIEKPLCASIEGWEDLKRIVKRKNLITYIGCNLRFDPILQYLKNDLCLPEFFYARVICSSYLPSWRPFQNYKESYSSNRSLGGGVILDLVHEPDYCHWLFGPIGHIQGTAGKYSSLDLNVEDCTEMTLFHRTGFRSHIHLDYFGRQTQRKIELFGKNSYLEADLIERKIRTVSEKREEVTGFERIDRDYTYRKELDYFFQCLSENRQPMNNIEEHMSVLEPVLLFREKCFSQSLQSARGYKFN